MSTGRPPLTVATLAHLNAAGWQVIRQRTHARVLEDLRAARALLEAERDRRVRTEKWLESLLGEVRRLATVLEGTPT